MMLFCLFVLSIYVLRMCTYDYPFQSVLFGKKIKANAAAMEYFSAISTIFYTRPRLSRTRRWLSIKEGLSG